MFDFFKKRSLKFLKKDKTNDLHYFPVGCVRIRTTKKGNIYQSLFERRINKVKFYRARTFITKENSIKWLNDMNVFFDSQKHLFDQSKDEKFIRKTMDKIKELMDAL